MGCGDSIRQTVGTVRAYNQTERKHSTFWDWFVCFQVGFIKRKTVPIRHDMEEVEMWLAVYRQIHADEEA